MCLLYLVYVLCACVVVSCGCVAILIVVCVSMCCDMMWLIECLVVVVRGFVVVCVCVVCCACVELLI